MPAPESPLVHHLDADGVTLCVFEWGRAQRGAAPTIVLAHATGFHARCWDRVVERLPDRHVLAVDQRGHGRSRYTGPARWADFGRDLAAVARALAIRDAVGVGHSMGGHATTDAAALLPAAFRRLVLIDPVIAAPALYGTRAWSTGDDQHPTARRRDRWTSPDEMFDRFRTRAPFDTWDPGVLRDYCVHGLRPDGDAFVLACAPAFEASVYMAALAAGPIHASVRAIDVPVLVVRAKEPRDPRDLRDFRYSPTWPHLAAAFRHGRDLHLPDRTHFLPMEDPAFAAELIVEPILGD
ncbi:MAG: alpha/beta hydrolase [bacterium]|nr:alpha/beta hydrolase [bacterium]